MNFKHFIYIFFFFALFSCQDEDNKREKDRLKNAEKSEVIFNKINQNWNLTSGNSTREVETILNSWNEWKDFVNELEQKPKSSINAFRKKAIALSRKAENLNKNIPPKFDNPQVKSRISIILTQIHSLDLYMNLDQIPADKIAQIIPNINKGMHSLQSQFQEILRKEKIPLETGESDMIKMLDTTRAIPSSKK